MEILGTKGNGNSGRSPEIDNCASPASVLTSNPFSSGITLDMDEIRSKAPNQKSKIITKPKLDFEPVDEEPESESEPEPVVQIPDANADELHLYFDFIHEHVRSLGAKGELVLSSYGQDPDTEEKIPDKIFRFKIGQSKEMADKALQLTREQHRNVYLQLTTHIGLKGKQRGKEANFEMCFGCVADFDQKHDPATRELRLPLPPDMEVETSAGNAQDYLFFKPGIWVYKRAEQLCTALRDHCECDDGTITPTHPWRPPGLLNWPNAKKVREGRSRVPQVSRCLRSAGNSTTAPEDLFAALPGACSVEVKPGVDAKSIRSMTGDLKVDPNASPDIDRLMELKSIVPAEFDALWTLERKDLVHPDGTPDPSRYDMAFFNLTAQAGWPPQEMLNLSMAFRRKHKFNLKPDNHQYFVRSILKAKADHEKTSVDVKSDLLQAKKKAGLPVDPLEALAAARDFLLINTGLPIIKLVQWGLEEPSYDVVLSNGTIRLDSGNELTSFTIFKRRAFDAGFIAYCKVPRKQGAWSRCLEIMDVLREVRRYPKDSLEGRIGAWLGGFIYRNTDDKNSHDFMKAFEEQKHNEKPLTLMEFRFECKDRPVFIDGAWHIPSGRFHLHCADTYHFKSSVSVLNSQLARAGCDSVSFNAKKPERKNKTRIHYWRVPSDLLPPDMDQWDECLNDREIQIEARRIVSSWPPMN